MDKTITVQWAFVVGVFDGSPHLIDHDYTHEVKALRPATLDDIYAACFVASKQKDYWFQKPSPDAYTCAFVVFQLSDGRIAASPDVFEDLIPVARQTEAQALGAFGVLQAQIIAQKTADIAAPLAAQATLSMLSASAKRVEAADPNAPKKSQGGLVIA
jgi:hypothetical protein